MKPLLYLAVSSFVLYANFGCATSKNGTSLPCARFVSLSPAVSVAQPPVLADTSLQITYPDLCQRAGIEGRVELDLIVAEDGSADSVYVWRGIGGGCDEAAAAVKLQTFSCSMDVRMQQWM